MKKVSGLFFPIESKIKQPSLHVAKLLLSGLFLIFIAGYTSCVQGTIETAVSITKENTVTLPTSIPVGLTRPVSFDFSQELDLSTATQTLMKQDPNATLVVRLDKLTMQISGVHFNSIKQLRVTTKNITDGTTVTLLTQDSITSTLPTDTLEISSSDPLDLTNFLSPDGKVSLQFSFEGDVGAGDKSLLITSKADLNVSFDFEKSLVQP